MTSFARFLLLGVMLAAAACAAPQPGYIAELPTETPAARAERHRRIAERRAGTILLVHRGAAAFAPENTLEAYAAAMDHGADGCEIDLRRTADGVLVLFHDDMLDHLTDGFGEVEQISYHELLSLRPRFVYGTATRGTRPPTFGAVLALARRRAMLLYLDVKRPGLDAEVARMLNAADAWDHVVGLNTTTLPVLMKDPRLKLLPFKGPGLYESRRDVDPDAVREQLARPGQMVMVDDPRVAARELKRPPYQPVPLPSGLRKEWTAPAHPAAPEAPELIPQAYLWRRFAAREGDSPTALLAILRMGTDEERRETDGTPEYQRRRTEGILDRAWAAQRLGQLGRKTPEVVRELEEQLRRRSLHRDWMYHGLDGAMAARGLGALRATEAAPALVEAFRRIDPELKKVVDPRFAANPPAWTDFRTKMYVLPALGELRCTASKQLLQEYVAMDPAAAREIAPPQFEAATRALLRQDLSRSEIEALLKHPNSAVRGTAILECLDHASDDRTAALRAAAPWAVTLPRAQR